MKESTHSQHVGPVADDAPPKSPAAAGESAVQTDCPATAEPLPPLGAGGRRGFIKLGAGALPASLTLASQPVMAWHCNSPSAAASASISANASVQTRTGQAAIADECWAINDWKNNSSRSGIGQPWTRLQQVTGLSKSSCTVNQVFSGITKPAGLTNQGTSNAYNVLRSLSNSSFEAVVMTARLNYLSVDSVRQCLGGTVSDELAKMTGGLYLPSSSVGIQWGPQQIIDYLNNNWIARQ